ncbi:MAG: MBL fold metallo-hydrolase [Gammaproteobacteria bacterium]|nr:MBL fold metallo-hydrolase [Gammaproteobacteria bacterium]
MNAHRAWTCVLLAHVAIANAATWSPATIPLNATQVGPRSWYVEGRLEDASKDNQGFMSNAGFVITDEGVVVFDALGTPALGDLLVQEIRRHTAQPIRRVIISHYHADHFYGVAALRAAGAEVWAHVKAERYLRSDNAQTRLAERRQSLGPWLGSDFALARPDRWLSTDESFELGGVRFSLQHVGPGHAPEDLVMLVEPDGVLYSGDIVYAGRVPFVGDADTRAWLGAIERLLKIPARVLVPGHGPASRSPRDELQLTHEYLIYLRKEMARAVADFVPFAEAYARIDWRRFAVVPTFKAANRNNAYNIYLQMEGEALHGK